MKLLAKLLDFLGSTWLGVGLMALALVYMSIGSALPAIRQYYELTETAWFQTPAFGAILGLLVLSMLVATVRRVTWSRAKAGAWLAHAGALVLCAGAWIYFGHKVEGDVTIPRRAVEIRLPGAEPVRLPAVIGAAVTGREIYPNKTSSSIQDKPKSTDGTNISLPTNSSPADNAGRPGSPWQFTVVNINPIAQPNRPKLHEAMVKKKKVAIYQVDLRVDRPADIRYKCSVFDGFEEFNEFPDNRSEGVISDGPFNDDPPNLFFHARMVLDPVRHFYLRDSAALYVQKQKNLETSQPLNSNSAGSQPDQGPICWFPASRFSLFTPTELFFTKEYFRTLYPLRRSDEAWCQYPLTGQLPLYREAYDSQVEAVSPRLQLAQLTWYQTPHMQLLLVGFLLLASVFLSTRVLPSNYHRQLWVFYSVLGLVLIGLLAYRWEINNRTRIYNHGPLDIPAGPAVDELQIRIIGYLPYTDGEHIIPKASRKSLRDVGRMMSMIEVEVTHGAWRQAFWLPFVEDLHLVQSPQVGVVEVPGVGLVRLAYSRERLPLPEPMALVDFIHEKGLGGETSADFISLLAVGDPDKGPVRQGPDIQTRLNEPYSDGTYQYYQAAYDPQYLSSTTLLVTNRHGLGVMLAGIILMVLGMAWAFYVKPMMTMKSGQ